MAQVTGIFPLPCRFTVLKMKQAVQNAHKPGTILTRPPWSLLAQAWGWGLGTELHQHPGASAVHGIN